jgi:hypothetical protein
VCSEVKRPGDGPFQQWCSTGLRPFNSQTQIEHRLRSSSVLNRSSLQSLMSNEDMCHCQSTCEPADESVCSAVPEMSSLNPFQTFSKVTATFRAQSDQQRRLAKGRLPLSCEQKDTFAQKRSVSRANAVFESKSERQRRPRKGEGQQVVGGEVEVHNDREKESFSFCADFSFIAFRMTSPHSEPS